VSGKKSVLEYVDHLHEHFFHPSEIKDGYYVTPMSPGYVFFRIDGVMSFETDGSYQSPSFGNRVDACCVLRGAAVDIQEHEPFDGFLFEQMSTTDLAQI
jgi:L-galactonate dehydratase